ncbi:hypothetical protein [Acidicapsa ligni]|uniref:hypothetical protein n=1 Tax=Acidicapsa ligni TaxID=542300 RepID=UPI0021E0A8A2|nr:hypothetical protein [Acidicapsa ligni]
MAETAVGLYGHASTADAVVGALRANGFPAQDIRVIAAPGNASGSVDASASDFGTTFAGNLRAFGVNEYESDAYLAGVNRGNVLVYATGSAKQVQEAVAIMDEYEPIEIEQLTTTAPVSTSRASSDPSSDLGTINPESRLPESSVSIGAHEKSYTSHASRSRKEGARIFSW